jgi:hypothetical protein
MDGPQIDELKELVKVSLQQQGVLGGIKAQLRAEVFKVVNKEQSGKRPRRLAAMSTQEGQVNRPRFCRAPPLTMSLADVVCGFVSQCPWFAAWQVAADLVREFLEHFELHSTLAVFLPEASLEDGYPGRTQLAQRLGIENENGLPLLMSLMKGGRVGAAPPSAQKVGTPTAGEKGRLVPLPHSASPAGRSPAVDSAQQKSGESKFAFGAGGPDGAEKTLGSLASAPPLPGMSAATKNGSGLAEAERVRKLQELAALDDSAERRSLHDENESDESLTR